MHTRRGKTKNHIAGLNPLPVYDSGFVHNAHGKASQIVLIFRIEARHLGSLSAVQTASSLNAAFCHTRDDLRYLLRHILAQSNVVQEYQRLGATANYIIDTHGNAVDTDGIVLIHQKGNLEFSTNTISAGYQYRLFDTSQIQLIHTAESSDGIQYTRSNGTGHMLLHQFHSPVTSGNIHTGCFIAVAVTAHI